MIIMKLNFDRSIRKAIRNGTVIIGSKETLKSLDDARLIVTASNTPAIINSTLEQYPDKAYKYSGSGIDLGTSCGLPYAVSTLAVMDVGDSDIMAFKSKNEDE